MWNEKSFAITIHVRLVRSPQKKFFDVGNYGLSRKMAERIGGVCCVCYACSRSLRPMRNAVLDSSVRLYCSAGTQGDSASTVSAAWSALCSARKSAIESGWEWLTLSVGAPLEDGTPPLCGIKLGTLVLT